MELHRSIRFLKTFLIIGMMLLASAGMTLSTRGQSDPIMPSQATPGTSRGASLSIYGIEGVQGLTQGTDQVVLFISSLSQSSQDPNKMNFVVDNFAISGASSGTATMHMLSPGLPGVMDTKTNEVQIDVSKLTSYVQSASNIGIDELKNRMKPAAGSLIVSSTIDTQTLGSTQSTFQVKNIAVVTQDGKVNSFSLADTPIIGTYDVASMKVYIVISQLSSIASNFLTAAGTGPILTPSPSVVPPQETPAIPPTTTPQETPPILPASPTATSVPVPITEGPIVPAVPIGTGGPIIPAGPIWTGGTGGPIGGHGGTTCPTGQHKDPATNKCVDDTTTGTCSIGQHMDPATNKCVLDTGAETCPSGQKKDQKGKCVNTCPGGQRIDATGKCVTDECPKPLIRDEKTGKCISDSCPVGTYRNWRGYCVPEAPCPVGQIRDDTTGKCSSGSCKAGQYRNTDGTCVTDTGTDTCPASQHKDTTTGKCVPNIESESKTNIDVCLVGQHKDPISGRCVKDPVTGPCPSGEIKDITGQCSKGTCSTGYKLDPATSQCVYAGTQTKPCPAGQITDPVTGKCIGAGLAGTTCPTGQHKDSSGKCVSDAGLATPPAGATPFPTPTCPVGQHKDASGKCVPNVGASLIPTPCPIGQSRDRFNNCVSNVEYVPCPLGQHQDSATGKCVSICPAGQRMDPTTLQCIAGNPPSPIPTITPKPSPSPTVKPSVSAVDVVPCPLGQHQDSATGKCVSICTTGQRMDPTTLKCVGAVGLAGTCPTGQHKDASGKCISDTSASIKPTATVMPTTSAKPKATMTSGTKCFKGQHKDPATGKCVSNVATTGQTTVKPANTAKPGTGQTGTGQYRYPRQTGQ